MLLLFFLTSQVFYFANGCPKLCRCYESRRQVHCNKKNFRGIPYGIPPYTERLLLQENLLTGGPAFERSLASLKKLKVLNLSGNRLTSFPRGLPSALKEVVVDSNNIKFMGGDSIKQLPQLSTLSLKNNNISSELGLSSAAFNGGNNLKTLTLSGNSLTSVPMGLPPNLIKLFLNSNKIKSISSRSLRNLGSLENFVVWNNSITNENIELGALEQLENLLQLDLSYNKLTDVPAGLPRYLEKLQLSNNKLEYLYASSSAKHSTLVGLPIKQLDLSSNQLKSMEKGSLENINPFIQLQDNPWQCDCHLKYLKSWLNITTSVLTGEGRIKCASPSTLQAVTLSSLDMEALVCPYANYRSAIQFGNFKPNSVSVRWRKIAENTPKYVSMVLLYGKLKCQNCSFSIGSELHGDNERVIKWITEYKVIKMAESHIDIPNTTITLSNLETGIRYAVCASDTSQVVKEVANGQCHIVKLSPAIVKLPDDRAIQVPSLSIILIVVVSALVVLIVIVATMIIRQSIKVKNEKRILKTRANATPFPTEIIDQVLQRNTVQQTYPRMGLTAPSQYRDHDHFHSNRRERNTRTMDGRNEYDVTLVYNGQPHINNGISRNNINEESPLNTNRTDGNSNVMHESLLNEEIAQYHDAYHNQQIRRQETVPMATYLEKPCSTNSSPHSRDTGVFV